MIHKQTTVNCLSSVKNQNWAFEATFATMSQYSMVKQLQHVAALLL